MKLIEKLAFADEIIEIDRAHFKECKFSACRLVYNGEPFRLEDCDVGEDCTYVLTGPALRTVILLSEAGVLPPELPPRIALLEGSRRLH